MLWWKFGIVVGRIMNPIIMSVIFVAVFFPIGFLLRVFKVPINNNFDDAAESYWVERQVSITTMKDQF